MVIVTRKSGSLLQIMGIPTSLPATRMGVVIEGRASGSLMLMIMNGRHHRFGVVCINIDVSELLDIHIDTLA